jgi:hypothetical protein
METTIENYNWIYVLPIFLLLFIVIWRSLKHYSFFRKPFDLIIALCVSVLCVVSLFTCYIPEQGLPYKQPSGHPFVLLPLFVLAIMIILSFAVLILLTAITIIKRILVPLYCGIQKMTRFMDKLIKPTSKNSLVNKDR